MEVTSATSTQTAAQTQAAASDKDVVNSDYTTFLKMLTAQVQNQDPLDPMSSDDFSSQLATFSGVEQQVKTNDLLAALGVQMGAMGMSQYASWIGLEARAAAPANFDDSSIISFFMLTISERDIFRSMSPVGVLPVTWYVFILCLPNHPRSASGGVYFPFI